MSEENPTPFNDGMLILSAEDAHLAELLGAWGVLEFAQLLFQLPEATRQEIRTAVGALIGSAAQQ